MLKYKISLGMYGRANLVSAFFGVLTGVFNEYYIVLDFWIEYKEISHRYEYLLVELRLK